MCEVSGFPLRSRAAASQPSMFGIMMSNVITAGSQSARTIRNASAPSIGLVYLESLELQVQGDQLA